MFRASPRPRPRPRLRLKLRQKPRLTLKVNFLICGKLEKKLVPIFFSTIARIAKAALHKLPGKSSLNVRSVCPVCPVCPGCPVCRVCPD